MIKNTLELYYVDVIQDNTTMKGYGGDKNYFRNRQKNITYNNLLNCSDGDLKMQLKPPLENVNDTSMNLEDKEENLTLQDKNIYKNFFNDSFISTV